MFLLDTNVVSNLRRRDRADARVRDWMNARRSAELFLSVVTVLEIELGSKRLARHDAIQGEALASWLHGDVLPTFSGRILPIDTVVALHCAGLHVPDPKSERDALIAATALVHSLTVVTRNVRDFRGTGVELLNPWEA